MTSDVTPTHSDDVPSSTVPAPSTTVPSVLSRNGSGETRERTATRTAAPARVAFSLVIPAYNESRRLAACLTEATKFLDAMTAPTELILVDDGSTDDTASIARSFLPSHPALRVIEIPHGGKAAAARAGLLAAQGSIVAFSDVDLATPLDYLYSLIAEIEHGADVAIASREGIGARRIGEPAYRHIMGRAFNLLVQALLLPGISDTQCGLKAFRSAAIREILNRALLYRGEDTHVVGARVTAFDVELLYIARCLGYRIAIVPVVWSAGEHSKVNPVRDTWFNLLDVLKVRWNGWRGRYT